MSGDDHDAQAERRRLIRERLRKARESQGDRSGIPARDPSLPVPLTSAQERLWFLERLMPDTGLFNIGRAFSLLGELDPRALARALAALLRRHRALCTAFVERQEGPQQVLGTVPAAGRLLPAIDLSAFPEGVARRLAAQHPDPRHPTLRSLPAATAPLAAAAHRASGASLGAGGASSGL